MSFVGGIAVHFMSVKPRHDYSFLFLGGGGDNPPVGQGLLIYEVSR